MASYNNLFNVRMLEEYIFCPLIFYYKYVLGITNIPSLWSTIGLDIQEELTSYVEENYKILEKQAFLKSEKYCLTGVVDFIIEYMNNPAPLEIKYSKKIKPWWKYTLTAYALLIEEKYLKPVKTAVLILPGPKTIIINITDNERRYVEKTIQNMKKIFEETKQPKPTRNCTNCDYKNICTKYKINT